MGDLAWQHSSLVIGIAVISAIIALAADLAVMAIHGSEVHSKRAFRLIGLLLQRGEISLFENDDELLQDNATAPADGES
jgi:hypothetical protein